MSQDLQQAVALHQAGRLDQAERLYHALLERQPDEVNALHLLAVLRQQQGRAAEAVPLFERALALAPGVAAIHGNYGNALQALARTEAAAEQYRRALALDAGFVDARYNLARLLKETGRFAEAVEAFDAVLAAEPRAVAVLNEAGLALQELGRFEAAAARFRAALALAPDQAELHHNLGNVLYQASDLVGAAASLRQALVLRPGLVETAIALGNVAKAQDRPEAALDCYAQALARAPDHVLARYNLGCVQQALQRHDQAAESFGRVLALAPDHAQAFDGRLTALLQGCDWSRYEADLADVRCRLGTGMVAPFVTLTLPLSPKEQLAAAQSFVAARCPPAEPVRRAARPRRERIHLAYLSADFHRHATAFLMAELFERHDRQAFEVTGISFGPDDGSVMRARIAAGFDRFLDLRAESDAAIADRVAALGVDIAIDLKGHTKDNRFGIFAHRPAPLQISYLGYPGTTGAAYIDYVIADPVVLPLDQQPFWTERIVHLPGCYQVNDRHRRIAPESPGRAESGLPAQGFVFCCFNNSYKIAPPVFAVWMRLLAAVPDSVLWLYRDNEIAERRLRAATERLGIDPGRLVFAPPLPLEAHLARHRLADLFLDTLPYNAHTTASDALWAGLPLVTCRGESFAARVAASLLAALGLDALVTESLDDYEALALRLARDPPQLAALGATLRQAAAVSPLFDGDACRRHLEAAYGLMWQRHCRGEKPSSFHVQAPGE